jgi:hypothetical protein
MRRLWMHNWHTTAVPFNLIRFLRIDGSRNAGVATSKPPYVFQPAVNAIGCPQPKSYSAPPRYEWSDYSRPTFVYDDEPRRTPGLIRVSNTAKEPVWVAVYKTDQNFLCGDEDPCIYAKRAVRIGPARILPPLREVVNKAGDLYEEPSRAVVCYDVKQLQYYVPGVKAYLYYRRAKDGPLPDVLDDTEANQFAKMEITMDSSGAPSKGQDHEQVPHYSDKPTRITRHMDYWPSNLPPVW